MGDFGFNLNSPYTLMGWIYVESTTINQSVIYVGDMNNAGASTSGDFFLLLQRSLATEMSSRIIMRNNSVNVATRTSVGNPIKRATWQHFAMTLDAAAVFRMYIDGVYNTNGAFSSFFKNRQPSPVGRIDIGPGITGYAGGFVGQIAHVKLWSRVLSATEIRSEAEYAAPLSSNRLVAWWPFNSSSDLGRDATGNGFDAYVNTAGSINPVYSSSGPAIDTYRPVLTYGQLGFDRSLRRDSTINLLSGLTFAGDTGRGIAKVLAGSLSFAATLRKSVLVRLLAILSFSHSLRTKRDLFMLIKGVLSFSSSNEFAMTKQIGGVLSFDGETSWVTRRLMQVAGSLSFSGSTRKSLTRKIGGSLSFADRVIRHTVINLAGSITPKAVLQFSHWVVIEADLFFNGHVTRGMVRTLSANLSFTGSVKSLVNRLVTIGGALSFNGSALRRVTKRLGGSVAFSGAVTKGVHKILAGAVSFASSFGFVRKGFIVISAVVSFSGSVTRTMVRRLDSSVSFGGVVQREWIVIVSSALTFGKMLGRTHTKNLFSDLSFTSAINRSFVVRVYGAVKFSAGVMAEKAGQGVKTTATLIGRKFSSIRLRGELDE